jgi:hypothetical protein
MKNLVSLTIVFFFLGVSLNAQTSVLINGVTYSHSGSHAEAVFAKIPVAGRSHSDIAKDMAKLNETTLSTEAAISLEMINRIYCKKGKGITLTLDEYNAVLKDESYWSYYGFDFAPTSKIEREYGAYDLNPKEIVIIKHFPTINELALRVFTEPAVKANCNQFILIDECSVFVPPTSSVDPPPTGGTGDTTIIVAGGDNHYYYPPGYTAPTDPSVPASGYTYANEEQLWIEKAKAKAKEEEYVRADIRVQRLKEEAGNEFYIARKKAECVGCDNSTSSTSSSSSVNNYHYDDAEPRYYPVMYRNKANGWEIANTLINGANLLLNGYHSFKHKNGQTYYVNNQRTWNFPQGPRPQTQQTPNTGGFANGSTGNGSWGGGNTTNRGGFSNGSTFNGQSACHVTGCPGRGIIHDNNGH